MNRSLQLIFAALLLMCFNGCLKYEMPTTIELNVTTLTMEVDNSETLIAEVKAPSTLNVTLTWSSGDESVASVNTNGKVTAKAEGRTTITATTSNGVKASCELIVVPEGTIIPVLSISLNKESISIKSGASETLSVTILPSDATIKTVVWSSNNNDIATVDKFGKVTAKADGVTTITAISHNTKIATCIVTVGEPAVPVTSVTLNKETLTIKEGESETLLATIAPSNATIKDITWTSSNTTIATVDATGKVTAKVKGNTTITATSHNSKTATCAVTVEVPEIPATGVVLSESARSMYSGDFYTLTATVSPANATVKTVTWTSNNEAIVKVDDSGKVTALSEGITQIIATTHNGKTASCIVTVNTNDIANGIFGTISWVLTFDGSLNISGSGEISSTTPPWAPYKSAIKTVNIGNGIVAIGESNFGYCNNLTSVHIPNSVTSIGKMAFQGCTNLKSVNIPTNMMTINESTFADCSSLTSITIPASVTSIRQYAFYGCSNLRQVTVLSATPPWLESANCFSVYHSLSIPSGSTALYVSSGFWNLFPNINDID